VSVDLSGAREALEGFMRDPRTGATCQVDRDAEGASDDVLDEETGAIVPPVGDDGRVWEGPLLVTVLSGSDEEAALTAGMDREDAAYVLKFPVDTPEFFRGDKVTLLTSADPTLVGERLVITRVIRKTIQVSRKALAKVDE
jgi:hypothetical protein